MGYLFQRAPVSLAGAFLRLKGGPSLKLTTFMDGNNVPIGAIQRILGHENRATTEIYLHSIGDMEREAINTFERAREKSHTDSHTDNQQQKEGQPN